MTAGSAPFYRSGFKWFLGLAPRLNKVDSFRSYVSLSLAMGRDTMELEPGYMVVEVFELSIYNHSNGMYYGYRASSNFHVMQTNSRFEHLIPLSKLLKSSDFMHDDCCVFGVEILKIDVFSPEKKPIVKSTTVQNLFIQRKGSIKEIHNVRMKNLLQQNSKDLIRSPTFELGGHKWYLAAYPHGEQYNTGCLSLYMYMDAVEEVLPYEPGPAVELALSIVDQKYGVNHFRRDLGLVVYPGNHRWGFSSFCPLSTLKGYIVESCCVIHVEMTIVGSSN